MPSISSRKRPREESGQKKYRQLCLDFGQGNIGAVTCPKCGMVYMRQEADVKEHNRLCVKLQQEAIERTRREEVGRANVANASEETKTVTENKRGKLLTKRVGTLRNLANSNADFSPPAALFTAPWDDLSAPMYRVTLPSSAALQFTAVVCTSALLKPAKTAQHVKEGENDDDDNDTVGFLLTGVAPKSAKPKPQGAGIAALDDASRWLVALLGEFTAGSDDSADQCTLLLFHTPSEAVTQPPSTLALKDPNVGKGIQKSKIVDCTPQRSANAVPTLVSIMVYHVESRTWEDAKKTVVDVDNFWIASRPEVSVRLPLPGSEDTTSLNSQNSDSQRQMPLVRSETLALIESVRSSTSAVHDFFAPKKKPAPTALTQKAVLEELEPLELLHVKYRYIAEVAVFAVRRSAIYGFTVPRSGLCLSGLIVSEGSRAPAAVQASQLSSASGTTSSVPAPSSDRILCEVACGVPFRMPSFYRLGIRLQASGMLLSVGNATASEEENEPPTPLRSFATDADDDGGNDSDASNGSDDDGRRYFSD